MDVSAVAVPEYDLEALFIPHAPRGGAVQRDHAVGRKAAVRAVVLRMGVIFHMAVVVVQHVQLHRLKRDAHDRELMAFVDDIGKARRFARQLAVRHADRADQGGPVQMDRSAVYVGMLIRDRPVGGIVDRPFSGELDVKAFDAFVDAGGRHALRPHRDTARAVAVLGGRRPLREEEESTLTVDASLAVVERDPVEADIVRQAAVLAVYVEAVSGGGELEGSVAGGRVRRRLAAEDYKGLSRLERLVRQTEAASVVRIVADIIVAERDRLGRDVPQLDPVVVGAGMEMETVVVGDSLVHDQRSVLIRVADIVLITRFGIGPAGRGIARHARLSVQEAQRGVGTAALIADLP